MQSLPQELFAIRAIPNTYLGVNYYHMRRYLLRSVALSKLQGDTRPITNNPIQDTQVDYERSIES